MNLSPREPLSSPKIKSWHQDRAALVYVRQSTPQQVADHQESTARQYALAERAVLLGWPRPHVQVIDDDLGKSGQSIEGRPGFQRLLAEVALDHVGLILALEMSRLARSCKDWHQLLELCARFRVLLGDADGLYDPNEYSDRLLLGLTGMMSEAELHVLKSRMHQGKVNKAHGAALLAGVVWCGRCGRRMYVRYRHRGQRPSYVCSWQQSDYGLPLCQSASAESVEAWLAEQILAALEPAALAASLTAASQVEAQRQQQLQHWQQRLERARYEADRAARQYHACEPENRLVARTLERRWDEALQEVGRLEAEFERYQRSCPRLVGESDREQIRRLAEEVPALWQAPTTTAADRRQIARLLLERVVLTVDPARDRVTVRVEWAGGAVREHTLRRAVRGYKDQDDWPRLSALLTKLYRSGRTAKDMAVALDREGFRPPKRAGQFSASMVRRLLHELGLRARVPRCTSLGNGLNPEERWLPELAEQLGLSPHTLHGWRKKGWLSARQVGGRGGPWAVWANEAELTRLRELQSCPRLWRNRERLAQLRLPTPRQ
jgi:hypothetical protein